MYTCLHTETHIHAYIQRHINVDLEKAATNPQAAGRPPQAVGRRPLDVGRFLQNLEKAVTTVTTPVCADPKAHTCAAATAQPIGVQWLFGASETWGYRGFLRRFAQIFFRRPSGPNPCGHLHPRVMNKKWGLAEGFWGEGLNCFRSS
jgi:hypothetical protein